MLTETERKCLVWDIERGAANEIEPFAWQTDTCIGNWHYDRSLYDRNGYKSARTVIQTLCDVVSKNGNLLLNIPVRGNGTIDEKEQAVLEGIGAWMNINKECIFDTRPWKVFGEGPASEGPALSAQGFNEGKGRPFGAADFRFTVKGNLVYVIELGWPTNAVSIKSLGMAAKLLEKPIGDITLLGAAEKLKWSETADALIIQQPEHKPNDTAIVFKITD
jgi:alpha-L-fucosidase